MSIPQLLASLAIICLLVSAFLARAHLTRRRGLRLIFSGLLISGVIGIAITFSTSLPVARLLSLVMLSGIGIVVRGIHVDQLQQRI